MKGLISVVLLAMVCLTGCGKPQPQAVTVAALSRQPSRYAKAYVQAEGILIHDHYITIPVEGGECIEGTVYRLQDEKDEVLVYTPGGEELRAGLKKVTGYWVKPPGEDYRIEVL